MPNSVDFSANPYADLCGWIGHDAVLLQNAFNAAPDHMKQDFHLIGAGPVSRRMPLFEIVRRVLGNDIENINQLIGDCVSWGAKHAVEYLECFQIAMGNMNKFRLIFPSYHYGTGRVLIGGQKGDHQDGSIGVWQIQAIQKYGVICNDDPNVPPYSAKVAKTFGADDGNVLEQFTELGQKHLIQKTAKVTTWDQLVDAVCNGYPVTVASNQGFTMNPQSDGFHHPSGRWDHQMCITYVDDDGGAVESHGGILNSWGDVMGSVVDFRDKSLKWPVGMIRARKNVIVSMLEQGDSWAYGSFQDFVAQILSEEFFSNF